MQQLKDAKTDAIETMGCEHAEIATQLLTGTASILHLIG